MQEDAEMPGPLVEPVEFANRLGNRVRVDICHFAAGPSLAVDSRHRPSAPEKLLRQECVLVSVHEPNQLEVA